MWENNEALDSHLQTLPSFLLSFSLLFIFRVARASRWSRYGSGVKPGSVSATGVYGLELLCESMRIVLA